MKKIVVGMSGGMDSAMALILLKESGWEPVGVSLKYAVWEDDANPLRENICCSAESFALAKMICEKFGAPHHILDVSKEFKKQVIDYFISELKNGLTPNPCTICNPRLKFKFLFKWAKEHGIENVATGHYARTLKDPETSAFRLLISKDKQKDQTYSLSFLPYDWLQYLVFPLGDYLKSEIFEQAEKRGLDFYLKRKQSQDFCFVSPKALGSFHRKVLGLNPGPIKNPDGKILGEHNGLHFYTLGQRKGLGLSQGPYFVLEKNLDENILLVTKDEQDLYRREVLLYPYNLLAPEPFEGKIKVKARLRYRQPLKDADLQHEGKFLRLNFSTPRRAPTPGQFAVFYDGETCLGAGRIVSGN